MSEDALPIVQGFEEFEREVAPIVAPPWQSRFGAVPWRDLDAPGPQHEWLVKGLLTEGELSMLAGASQSGKSFLMIDLAMSIARGEPWFGRPVKRGGVIYQAGEGASGLRRRRLPAYRQENGLSLQEDIPFVLLPAKVNLWDGEADTDALIQEIEHWRGTFDVPLRLIVIDTLAKAMTGGDEISGKDMGVVIDRCEKIKRVTKAAVVLVHHLNASGEKVRGHTSTVANLDAVLMCRMTERAKAKNEPSVPLKDADGRDIREMVVGKLKDGDTNTPPFRFVLRGVMIGRDADGDPITSCVVQAPNKGAEGETPANDAGLSLSAQAAVFLQSVIAAIEGHGEAPPAELNLPGHTRVVEWKHVREAFAAKSFEGESEDDPERRANTIKKALQRHGALLAKWRVINKGKSDDGRSWIWFTGRKVRGHKLPGTQSGNQDDEPTTPRAGAEPEPDDNSLPF